MSLCVCVCVRGWHSTRRSMFMAGAIRTHRLLRGFVEGRGRGHFDLPTTRVLMDCALLVRPNDAWDCSAAPEEASPTAFFALLCFAFALVFFCPPPRVCVCVCWGVRGWGMEVNDPPPSERDL